jgi:hypothetical protein
MVNCTSTVDLKEHNGRAWTGLIWLRIKTNGWLLRTSVALSVSAKFKELLD